MGRAMWSDEEWARQSDALSADVVLQIMDICPSRESLIKGMLTTWPLSSLTKAQNLPGQPSRGDFEEREFL